MLVSLAFVAVGQAEQRPLRVLLLNSYDQEMAWVRDVTRAVEEEFLNWDREVILHVENMDTKRFHSAEYYQNYYDLLLEKFSGVELDLIVSSDDNAFSFIKKYRDSLWPGVPVAYCGINDYDPESFRNMPWAAGAAEYMSADSTVRLMLKIHPDLKRIYVLNDYLVSGRKWESNIRKQLKSFEDKVDLIWNKDLSVDELRQRIKELGPGSAVLLGAYFSDDRGNYFATYEKTGKRIMEGIKIPGWCLLSMNVGNGCVGGDVISGYYQGLNAARIGKRILEGESPSDISTVTALANKYMFSYPEMQQLGISEGDLPEGSMILNKPVTFYEKYRHQVWLGTTFLVFLIITVILQNFHIIRQRQIRRELEIAEEKYRDLVQLAQTVIVRVDQDGYIVFVNDYGRSLFGYDEGELQGKDLICAIMRCPEAGQDEVDSLRKRFLSSSEYTQIDDLNCYARNGDVAWISWVNHTIIEDDGSGIKGWLCVGQDTGERKAAKDALEKLNAELEDRVAERTHELEVMIEKLRSTQSQLVESEKMASLGNLVAGVAHEINTPIGIGVTSVTFLEEKLNNIDTLYTSGRFKRSDLESFLKTGKEAIASTLSNLRRAAELIQSFKQVAVDQTSEDRRIFNVKSYVEEILLSLRPKYKRTKHVVEVVGDDDATVKSYPGALMQIITNMVVNSLVHGFEDKEQGHIEITVRNDNKEVEVLYRDNGKGMSEDDRTKVFEPFFSTKKGRGGSGLGMHIAYNLVTQKMGGTIECKSTPGEGTLFKITIPGIEAWNAAE